MTTTLAADELAFLRGICDSPDDDAPRLVLADWLEEHGQGERAEFIRLDIRRWREWPDFMKLSSWERSLSESGRELQRVDDRIGELFGLRGGVCRRCDWHLPLKHGDGSTWSFQRGFVAEVALPLAAFLGGECGRCRGEGRVGQHWDPASDTMRGGTRCPACGGTGTTPGAAAALRWMPVERVTFSDAVIHESGGNMTYYVGGLGQWPREYWSRLDNLPSRKAATDALSAAAVAYLRGLRGGPCQDRGQDSGGVVRPAAES
jgi:uncharacterized protein (TIGR02996 family)